MFTKLTACTPTRKAAPSRALTSYRHRQTQSTTSPTTHSVIHSLSTGTQTHNRPPTQCSQRNRLWAHEQPHLLRVHAGRVGRSRRDHEPVVPIAVALLCAGYLFFVCLFVFICFPSFSPHDNAVFAASRRMDGHLV